MPLLYGFGAGLYDDFSNAGIVLLGLAFFLLQVVAANWWLRHLIATVRSNGSGAPPLAPLSDVPFSE